MSTNTAHMPTPTHSIILRRLSVPTPTHLVTTRCSYPITLSQFGGYLLTQSLAQACSSDDWQNPGGEQIVQLNLVLRGFAVLSFDPIGQGERQMYADLTGGIGT